MNVQERIRVCRIICEMEMRPELSKRLGLENRSTFYGQLIEQKYVKRGNEK